MFETLARRNKSLVDLQLELIEKLQFEERDPNTTNLTPNPGYAISSYLESGGRVRKRKRNPLLGGKCSPMGVAFLCQETKQVRRATRFGVTIPGRDEWSGIAWLRR